MEGERAGWRRFVLYRADKETGEAMRPRLTTGAVLLIDRHSNLLRNERRHEAKLYLVKFEKGWRASYVDLHGGRLTLRPESQGSALVFVDLRKGETAADYVVGRVTHVAMDL
jgi:hypothetical protein